MNYPGQSTDQASGRTGLPDVGESTKKQRRPAESEQQRCPRCGMDKAGWTANDARGFELQGTTYCCEGCAKNTGCTCSVNPNGTPAPISVPSGAGNEL
jgi:hypothetical protein